MDSPETDFETALHGRLLTAPASNHAQIMGPGRALGAGAKPPPGSGVSPEKPIQAGRWEKTRDEIKMFVNAPIPSPLIPQGSARLRFLLELCGLRALGNSDSENICS